MKKGPGGFPPGPFPLASFGLFGASERLDLIFRQRLGILHCRRHGGAATWDQVDFDAAVSVRFGGLRALAFLGVRGSARTRSGFRRLVSADPINPDAGRIDLGAGAGAAAENSCSIQYALLIESRRRCCLRPLRAPRAAGAFSASSLSRWPTRTIS
jgi:hypothetical protein